MIKPRPLTFCCGPIGNCNLLACVRRRRARPVARRSLGRDRAGRFRYTKDDDLAGHRTGSSVISELVEQNVEVLVNGAAGVTFFLGLGSGTFEGQPMAARLRYTRTWMHDSRAAGRFWRPISPW